MPGWFREDVLSWKPKDGAEVSFLTPVDNLQIESVSFMR